MGWTPSWVNVRTQVATLFVTVVFEPAPQTTGLPWSKKETVPPFMVLCGLVSTVAVIVAGLEGLGGVRKTDWFAGDTAVVVAEVAAPEVVMLMVQPPLNEYVSLFPPPPLLTTYKLQ